MKKFFMKYSSVIAALALVITAVTANSTCIWLTYQEELPDAAKQLRRF